PQRSNGMTWGTLPSLAQLYLAVVIAGGMWTVAVFLPTVYPQPVLFGVLVALSCVTSAWKVNLPISLASGSTLWMSYAANLMSLLLLGPRYAIVIGVVGAWTQCTYKVKQPYPLYRTAFSAAAEAITMAATGFIYLNLGGPIAPLDSADLAKPLVAS